MQQHAGAGEMRLRFGVLDEAEDDPAVGADHQLLPATALPECGERRRRDAHHRLRRAGDVHGNRERKETGRVQTRMGDDQRVAAGGDAVYTEATIRIGLRMPLAAADPDIGAAERGVQQAVIDRSYHRPLGRGDLWHQQ